MMENKENTTPPIKCGYCGWFIGALLNTSLSRHKCFELYNDESQFIHIDDNNIVTIVEKVQSSPTDSEDYNECLIAAVQARPGLYDHRIPVKERTGLKKKALWKEVLNVLGEKEKNLELVQKRWKQLRDCYVKARRKETEYIPSGSAANCSKISKKGFGFYNQMKFLDDLVGKSLTISSLPDKMNIDDIESAIEEPLQVTQPQTSHTSTTSLSDASLSPSQQQPKPKKSRNCDNISDVKEAILSALEGGSRRNPDAIDGFFLQIGDRVRALPVRERAQFEMKVQSLLFEFEQELSLL